MTAEELVRLGRVDESLKLLAEQVKNDPSNAKLRVFLFQLLSVLGKWDKALTQLNVAAELDSQNLLMAQVCRTALACEALREEIFSGRRTPLIFGQPSQWVGLLVEANRLSAEGKHAASGKLRQQAFDAAPATPGSIDGAAFEWIADADGRLGPMFEGIIEGKYYWIPVENVRQVLIEKPSDLRDLVWTPVTFIWANGGNSVGLMPTRYPGSEASSDSALLLARKTEWLDRKGLYTGLGQRMFASNVAEYALLETSCISLGQATDVQNA